MLDALLLLMVLIWGTNYSIVKAAFDEIDPQAFNALRMFLASLVFGVILGLLTVRSKSLLPAIAFHLLHNTILIALIPISRYSDGQLPESLARLWPWWTGISLVLAALLVWWLYRKPYADLERQESGPLTPDS